MRSLGWLLDETMGRPGLPVVVLQGTANGKEMYMFCNARAEL